MPATEVNIANAIIRLLEVANFLEIDITGTYSASITPKYENPYDMFFCLIPRIFDLEAFIDHIKRRRKKSTLNKLRNVGPAFGGIIYELFKLGQVLNLDVKTAILEISNLPHSSK